MNKENSLVELNKINKRGDFDLKEKLLITFNTYEKILQKNTYTPLSDQFIDTINSICEQYNLTLVELIGKNYKLIGINCMKKILDTYRTYMHENDLTMTIIYVILKLDDNPLKFLIEESKYCYKNINCLYPLIFMVAVRFGHLDVLQWLVETFVFGESKNIFRISAYLRKATKGGHKHIIEWLLKKYKPDFREIRIGTLYELAEEAEEMGHSDIAELLKEYAISRQ